ncbi:MAG: hypothetical protein Q4G02_01610 [bacterium]|nr:hypothetical protein [bacterium]
MAQQSKFNLTNFMDTARTSLVFGGIFLVLVTVWQIAAKIYANSRPKNANQATQTIITPDYAFGALPAITFPSQLTSVKPQSYELAIDGVNLKKNTGWPSFGQQGIIPVYKLSPLNYSLNAENEAQKIATNLEFPDDPKILDSRTYLFTYPGPPLKENLEIDLKTMFVTLTTDYLTVDNIFALTKINGERYLPDRSSAIAAVKNYLSKAGILPTDLSDTDATVEYAKRVGNQLELVDSILEADFVTVSLPRKPIAGYMNDEPSTYGFFGPNNVSSIYGVVGRDYENQDVVVELEDYYYRIDTNVEGTYNLKTVADAWQSLQAGAAYVVNPRQVKNAVIKKVALGYYESHQEQEYLLPIYVFYGENGFLAYVQALHPNMLQSQ